MKKHSFSRFLMVTLLAIALTFFNSASIVTAASATAYYQSGGTASLSDHSFSSTVLDESAVKVVSGGVLTLTDSTITKSGNTSSMDDSSFYGLNAGVLAAGAAKITLNNITINTTGSGANGVFAYGSGSQIDLTDVTINCTATGAHGVDATCAGILNMTNVNISTAGDGAAAAIATDRGGGTINVTGGTVKTTGTKSPGIYSTGAITVNGGSYTSTNSEAAVIEGKNSLALTNTTMSAGVNRGVIIYQSMSGDATIGTGNFAMTGGSLNAAAGPLFYVTNTDALITLSGASLYAASGNFLKASSGEWGTSGSNGGDVTVTADSQTITGNILCDSISTVDLTLKNNSILTGAIDSADTAKSTALTLDANSRWSVTANSYINGFTDADSTLANLDDNGFTIYYDSSAAASLWLGGLTYTLSEGGQLTPIPGAVASPTITSFTPANGGTGTVVVITGTNLSGASAVSFGATAAASFTVNNSTQITAVVSSGSSGKISVTTAGGTAASTAGFTYTASTTNAPTITSFTPAKGGTASTVVITGTNLKRARTVGFGGTRAKSFKVNSDTQITAIVGNGSSGVVSVTTSEGTAVSSSSFSFYSAPKISSFTPTSGIAGATVVIRGTNFDKTSAVAFGGTAAASFVIDSAAQITAVVGSGSTGRVTVTTPGGTASSSGQFTCCGVPTITSFTPSTGGKNTSVTINGTNFSGTTAVTFGGTAAAGFKVTSATRITARVAGGASGLISVTTPGGSAVSAASFTYCPSPAITSFSPAAGGAGTTIVITGSNFTDVSAVKIGSRAVSSFTLDSDTQISAVAGKGSTGKISVTTPGGTATSAAAFTYYTAPVIKSFTPASGSQGTTLTIKGANPTSADLASKRVLAEANVYTTN